MSLNRKKTHSKTFSQHMVNLLRNLTTISMVASINITVHLNRRNCSSNINIRMHIYILFLLLLLLLLFSQQSATIYPLKLSILDKIPLTC